MGSNVLLNRRFVVASALAASILPRVAMADVYHKYVYDALGRVGGVLYPNGTSIFYTYDSAGNRTSKRSGTGITDSGFDPDFYRIYYTDIYSANIDPYVHFQNGGWSERRRASAYFDTNWYLNTYPDIAAANINPLDHYSSSGWREGRNPSPYFNTTLYLQNYPDIAAANINPYLHFIRYGIYEGRSSFGSPLAF
ncbi:RHS repeat domain-containing protein [Asticcacaulis sp. 201]|uniref:RHS repeat domain-containing protein n=1 Tax=Asticcacaulis sp. 201 TaxID=3028787 RepID=UPI0029166C5B|nr:RHS repeat domain-containing protein [Asticcacaulis sp. 201]MDV6329859.1 RHS repeat domain-containing protein [Asticcacaulis sp. 201]